MIKREDIIIVYLTLSLWLVQYFWMQAEKKAAYLAGKQDMLTWMTVDDSGEGVHKDVIPKERWHTK